MADTWRARVRPKALHRTGMRDAAPEPPELSMDPRAGAAPAARAEESVVDAGLYLNGRRVERPASLTDAYQRLVAEPGTMAWIGLYRPAEEQLQTVAEQFGLHKLAVEDAIVAHQRPKLERYGDTLFVVLRAARYHDDVEEVHFGELHLFAGPNFVLTVRHDETPGLAAVRHRRDRDRGVRRRSEGHPPHLRVVA